ncbi:hypothetical protein QQF64_005117 [Cirrhinus molitorella]|uniref:Uncharacterized protein n=1 Tax=Cirrhinus molitorella TaxID=172907 RepID=A0ABR3MKH1_9TELE
MRGDPQEEIRDYSLLIRVHGQGITRLRSAAFICSLKSLSKPSSHSIPSLNLNSCMASPGGAAGIISHTEVISAMCSDAESSLNFKAPSESDGRKAGWSRAVKYIHSHYKQQQRAQ